MRVLFSPDGKQIVACGGVSLLSDMDLIEYPDEQIRLYRVTETPADSPAPATK